MYPLAGSNVHACSSVHAVPTRCKGLPKQGVLLERRLPAAAPLLGVPGGPVRVAPGTSVHSVSALDGTLIPRLPRIGGPSHERHRIRRSRAAAVACCSTKTPDSRWRQTAASASR